jgi:hypothetical protein
VKLTSGAPVNPYTEVKMRAAPRLEALGLWKIMEAQAAGAGRLVDKFNPFAEKFNLSGGRLVGFRI